MFSYQLPSCFCRVWSPNDKIVVLIVLLRSKSSKHEHSSGSTINMNGTTVAWGLIFIFFLRFWTCSLWGSLISSGRRPVFSLTGGRWMWVMRRLKTCPFRTSFFWIIFLLILFWLDERTLDDNFVPSVALASLSFVELNDSDFDSLVTFVFVGLKCIGIFLSATFIWEGDGSFNETWPYMP